MIENIQERIGRPKGHVRLIFRDKEGNIVDVQEADNLVVDAGLAQVALATVDPTQSCRIAYVELGTGTNTPDAADVALQTSYIRKAVSSYGSASGVSTVTGYFDYSEANTTIREAGLFIGGTASAGTGTLFSRVALNVTKTGAATLTVEWTITWS